MSKNGYFIFDREAWLLDEVAKSKTLSLLMFYFTTHANWKDSKITWNGKPRILQAGSCLVSITSLAECWNESQTTLLRGVRLLRDRCVIGVETGTHGCIVSICNWKAIQTRETENISQVVHQRCASGPDSVLLELRTKNQEEYICAQTQKNGISHQGEDPKNSIQVEAEEIYKTYPKREGGQRKKEGMRILEELLKEGSGSQIKIAVQNYALHCRKRDLAGTPLVMMFRTFVGNAWEEWVTPANGKLHALESMSEAELIERGFILPPPATRIT